MLHRGTATAGSGDPGASVSTRRVVLVPGVLALLPAYAGLVDPVAPLRAACVAAVRWLAEDGGSIEVVGSPQGVRVGEALLEAAGVSRQALARLPQPPGAGASSTTAEGAAGVSRQALARLPQPPVGALARLPQPPDGALARLPQPPLEAAAYLVVGNGSARRGEKAPGHLDERAAGFDDALRADLTGAPDRLAGLDRDLARELWADVDSLVWLGTQPRLDLVQVDYDDDPYGVQYWVVRWTCDS